MSELVAPALVGEAVVLILAIGLVWIVFREVTKAALKLLLPAGALVAVAVWLGWLDQTTVGNTLVAVGDGVMSGIRSVADWVVARASAG